MPPTIQAVLTSRLEALDEEERLVAEVASVEGTSFHRAALVALTGLSHDAVDRSLGTLMTREMVLPFDRPTPGTGEDLGFRHQLIRDAAYGRLSKTGRAAWHERIAGWLARHGSAGEMLDEIVGYHLEQANHLLRDLDPNDPAAPSLGRAAADHLAAAGRRAFARSDMPAAANLLGRTVDLLVPGDPLRLASMPSLGNALAAMGRMREAGDLLTRAVDEARTAGDRRAELGADVELQLLHLMTDTTVGGAGGRREGERLLAALEGTGEDRTIAKAWNVIGFAELYAGRMGAMADAMRRSADHAARAGDAQQRSAAIQWLANAIARGPTPVPEAVVELERLRGEVDEGSEADAGLLVSLGLLHGMAGEIERARDVIGDGREMLAALGHRLLEAVYAMELCDAERFAGDAARAIPELRRAAETLETMGERDYRSTVCAYLARALAERGDVEEAEGWAAESAATAAEDDTPSQITFRLARAIVAAEAGDVPRAVALAREALAIAEAGDDPVSIGDTSLTLAVLLGDADSARDLAAQAQRLFEGKGAVRLAERARDVAAGS
jgi:tetratricopeptide (TPR) repeat protein